MKCEFDKYIDDLLNGTLKNEKEKGLMEHSKKCVECSSRLKEVERIDGIIKNVLEIHPERRSVYKIMSDIEKKKDKASVERVHNNWRKILYAAAIILVLGISAYLLKSYLDTNKGGIKTGNTNLAGELKIERHPAPIPIQGVELKSLPSYDSNSDRYWQVDLRGCDLNSLDIKDRLSDLMYADFDSDTKWTKALPDSFDPNKIMELGKNPGLGIDKLHKDGVTGKNIGIAIIDQALLVDHIEYKDNLKMYEEIHCSDRTAQMHGPAVASIAVGKNVGVAPGADLYYIAETPGEYNSSGFEYDFTGLAKSIDRILEVNKSLPNDKKIRVISISVGWNKNQKGYDEVNAAVNRAKEQGVFVVSSSLLQIYGYMFNGLGRDPLKDPDNPSSYEAGMFWTKEYYKDDKNFYSNVGKSAGVNIDEVLLVPMDSRTTASQAGSQDYAFYREGGWSWSIPYIAGLYALVCQVKPDITPDIFWSKALETGDTIKVQYSGKEYEMGKVVNPVKLIEAVKNIE